QRKAVFICCSLSPPTSALITWRVLSNSSDSVIRGCSGEEETSCCLLPHPSCPTTESAVGLKGLELTEGLTEARIPLFPTHSFSYYQLPSVLELIEVLIYEYFKLEICITFSLQVFTDGITNKLIGCYVGEEMDDVVLVRIYGNKTELLVDREEEVKSFRVLQAHGCAPQLYCTFSNGLCYEFMQGEALDPEHVCNPEIFRLIARQLAKIHAIHAHNGWIPKSNLWLKMGKYFSLIPTEFADQELHKRFLMDIPSPQVLQEEMAWMKERLSNLCSPVVLCHNDLLCKNIIYNGKQGNVQFIDYEYSGYNYLAYDIGNHFNEFAGVSEVDYSLYPNRKLQEQWLRAYLEAYKEYKGFETDVTEKEVEVLYVQVNQFALASHFFWGLWALIQAKYSTIDFDFLGYAIVRFNQYFKMKNEVMTLKLPE
ncbi:ethanolamine kinase 1-like, partial [Varanus komodoensis]|uniref:ethanolamine kinase 1-like n=2 Tax=Varanus komodoensis TaxID=61221 RepID=UPI001CF7BC31